MITSARFLKDTTIFTGITDEGRERIYLMDSDLTTVRTDDTSYAIVREWSSREEAIGYVEGVFHYDRVLQRMQNNS